MLNTLPRDYSLIAPVYDHVFNRFLSEGHRELGQLLKSKRNIQGYRVLEVGVGSGLTFEYLPNHLEFHGVDINNEMLSIAMAKAERNKKKKITLKIMDAHKLAYGPQTFDLVMAASVLSAVEDPKVVMKQMIKVTKKGGEIAIIVNVRDKSYKSQIVRVFDPFTKKLLGFRTDMSSELFREFSELELVESKDVNNILGFPLSRYMLFRRR